VVLRNSKCYVSDVFAQYGPDVFGRGGGVFKTEDVGQGGEGAVQKVTFC